MSLTVTLADDDLLAALRTRSEAEGRPLEAVLTDAARRGLAAVTEESGRADTSPAAPAVGAVRDGIRLFPVRPGTPVVTHDLILRMLDETE